MLKKLVRLGSATTSVAAVIVVCAAFIVVVFSIYVGVAMIAAIRSGNPEQAELRYRIFRDLLSIIRDLLSTFPKLGD